MTSHFPGAGEVTLYKWVEWLKEQRHLLPPAAPSSTPDGGTRPAADVDLDEELAAVASLDLDSEAGDTSGQVVGQQRALWKAAKLEAEKMAAVERTLMHGEPFTERKSTFQVIAGGECQYHTILVWQCRSNAAWSLLCKGSRNS